MPNLIPYKIATAVELKSTIDGVNLTITFDSMHNDVWTARVGYQSQLRKLDNLLVTQDYSK